MELEIISVYYLQRYGERWQQSLENFIEQLPFSDNYGKWVIVRKKESGEKFKRLKSSEDFLVMVHSLDYTVVKFGIQVIKNSEHLGW